MTNQNIFQLLNSCSHVAKHLHSTIENAVFTLTGNILTALNEQKQTAGIFCDLAEACDWINQNILLEKLFYCGKRRTARHSLRPYLTERGKKKSEILHKALGKIFQVGK